MNERLHQLCRQALEQARINACAKNKTDRPQNNTVWNEFPEVFAELIVRECAGVELYWLSEQDRKAVAEKIKQHFGVEE